jgi:hypothetical protein
LSRILIGNDREKVYTMLKVSTIPAVCLFERKCILSVYLCEYLVSGGRLLLDAHMVQVEL